MYGYRSNPDAPKTFKKSLPAIEGWYGRPYIFHECKADTINYDANPGPGIDGVYRAMTTCDNIRSLSIAISRSGYVVSSAINSFNWTAGDKFSSLEHLKISGYGWVNLEVSRRRSGFLQEPLRPESLAAWKEAMDWSKLKRLDIARPPREFLDSFHGELLSLRSFKLRPAWSNGGSESTFCEFDRNATELREAYLEFIKALPPLKELSIGGMGEILNITEILKVHGSSIHNLTVHELETDCRSDANKTWIRPTLGTSDLEALQILAPNLQHLELDIHRSQTWPWDALAQISQLQELVSVTLNFGVEDPQQATLPECHGMPIECTSEAVKGPQLDQEVALKIFQALRAGQKVQQLERATLRAGDEKEHGRNGIHAPEGKMSYTPVTFLCKSLLKGEECEQDRGSSYKYYGAYEFGREW
jgi:hypothetical protein